MHVIHSFNDTKPIVEGIRDEAIIFRNFHDCKSNCTNIVNPRRKNQADTFLVGKSDPNRRDTLTSTGVNYTNASVEKSLKEWLDEQSLENYAPFLKIFHQEDCKVMLNVENNTKFALGSSFIYHFSHKMVSTPVHSACVVDTYSVQCYGVKSWLCCTVKYL